MQARLVADIADVHLDGIDGVAAKRREIGVEEKRKRGVHAVSLD
jgi:hypothetical protein